MAVLCQNIYPVHLGGRRDEGEGGEMKEREREEGERRRERGGGREEEGERRR